MNFQKHLSVQVIAIFLFTILPFSLHAASGDLDLSFSDDGVLQDANVDAYYVAAVQDDGKIVTVGSNFSGGAMVITRYNVDGTLDTGFDSDGILSISSPNFTMGGESLPDIIIQADAKILVMGNTTSGKRNTYLTRLNPDGTIDTSFGQNGNVHYDIWSDFIDTTSTTTVFEFPNAMVQQSDGKIVVGGQYTLNGTDRRAFLFRLNADGSIDTSFGPFGEGQRIDYACSIWTYINDLALAPNGDIVVVGHCFQNPSYDSYVAVFDADGQQKINYSTDQSENIIGSNDRFKSVAVQPDGKIVAVGWGSFNFIIARYNYLELDDMALDSTFNSTGVASVSKSSNDRGWGLAIQPDGKLLLAGWGENASTTIIRFNTNGVLDTGFGTSGIATVTSENTKGIAMQSDGKILSFGFASLGGAGLSRIHGDVFDTMPDAFILTDQSEVAVNSAIVSNAVTVSGLSVGLSVPVVVENGEFSINGNTNFQSNIGYVVNDDQLQVRHTSASTTSTFLDTVLKVGGVLPSNRAFAVNSISDTFSSTTVTSGGEDTTPLQFMFTDVDMVEVSTAVTSNSIKVNGINTAAEISITNGEFSINNGAFASTPTTVEIGDTVKVKHISSSMMATSTSTMLSISGVTDTFTSITVSQGGEYSIPEQFMFTDVDMVELETVVTSDSIMVSGIDSVVDISITNGEFSINFNDFTSTATTVNNGDIIMVRHMSSSMVSTSTDSTLTIGGVSDTFTSTTASEDDNDSTPEQFMFTDVAMVELAIAVTSNSITVNGINTATDISITNGELSINNGAFTSTSTTVNNGDTVIVKHMSSSMVSTSTDSTLTIGGVVDTFTSTTVAADTTPDAFSFTNKNDVEMNQAIKSNIITISGINSPTAISISSESQYSINNGAFVNAAGTVSNGDMVQVQHTSAATASTSIDTELTIGGVSTTFTSVTAADPGTDTNTTAETELEDRGSLSFYIVMFLLGLLILRQKQGIKSA